MNESKSGDNSLRDWFRKSRASDGTPGWVQLGGKYAGKPCAKQPGQTTKPKCGSSKMKRNLNKDEEEAAFRRKNAKDPNPNRKGKAINVKTEETIIEKEGKKDACYKKVKASAKVWPSAYASGRLVQCRKKGAANYGNKSEGITFQQFQEKAKKCWDTHKKVGMKMKGGKLVNDCRPKSEEVDLQSQMEKRELNPSSVAGGKTPPSVKFDASGKSRFQKGIGEFANSSSGPYSMRGPRPKPTDAAPKTSTMNANRPGFDSKGVNLNPSKSKSDAKKKIQALKGKSYSGFTEEVTNEGAAWTKKEGKNKSGGLNEKGRKSYERENPGSDLKAPSKKVGNKRRASFCARMKGMRKRQKPSNNTGDDRLSKSLRAWNC
jgi:hypothetical protein